MGVAGREGLVWFGRDVGNWPEERFRGWRERGGFFTWVRLGEERPYVACSVSDGPIWCLAGSAFFLR